MGKIEIQSKELPPRDPDNMDLMMMMLTDLQIDNANKSELIKQQSDLLSQVAYVLTDLQLNK